MTHPMNTDPATLRALNVRRKADRTIMRDTLRTICNHPGIVGDIKEENRTITAHIATFSGLCATFCISPKYRDTLIHWFMGPDTVGTINPSFTYDINMSHRRKATSACADFFNVCAILDDKITKIRSGDAVIMPPAPTLTPTTRPNTNPTNTMQATSNPANVAHKATTTRDNITAASDILRHLFKSDNDAPRLFAEQLGDVLTEHGWRDPKTANAEDEQFSDIETERDNLKLEVRNLEDDIEELKAEINDLKAQTTDDSVRIASLEDEITRLQNLTEYNEDHA